MDQPVVFDPRTGSTYVGYYDATGRAVIARRASDGSWTSVALSDGAGPVIALPGKSDIHNSIALGLDSVGNLHICACMHDSDMRYWRSTSPGDLSSVTFRTALPGMAGKWKYLVAWGNEAVVTYPTFFAAQNGTLYLMFRNGQSGAGNGYLYRYHPDTTSWSNTVASGGPLFEAGGTTGFTDTPDNYCAYPTAIQYHADSYGGAYHIAWVWRADPTAESNTTVHYAWTRDFVNWYPINRSPASPSIPVLTFNHSNTVTLVDPTPQGGLLNEQVQVGFDPHDRVVITYYRLNELGETKLYTARPTGNVNSTYTTWRISDVTALPNTLTNVAGAPDPATYSSSWSGTANLDGATPVYNSHSILDNADGTMACRYSYRKPDGVYESRRLTFKNTGTSGVSFRVSDAVDLQADVPPAMLVRDSATARYPLAVRTSRSASFVVPPSGAWAGATPGHRVHWVLRWESGPYSAANQWSSNYPATGTELRLYLVGETSGASAGAPLS